MEAWIIHLNKIQYYLKTQREQKGSMGMANLMVQTFLWSPSFYLAAMDTYQGGGPVQIAT